MKKWMILDNSKLANAEDIFQVLLQNRGIKTKNQIGEFLNPSLNLLSLDEVYLKKRELDKSIVRIKRAIVDKEQIIVYTDYDADGVCSGTIVWEALFDLGAKVMPYVPHRVEEGYGLSQKGIDFIHKEYKAKLIITVDHGVTAWEKVDYAKKLGIDVIIIDHHTLGQKLPEVVALIHTTSLCATGVAWFFVKYLFDKTDDKKSDKKGVQNLDLVAIATIADLMPLTGTNRILVKYGLDQLNNTERLGLKALIKTSDLKQGHIGTYEVGHMLAPRINASGRLTHALDSLRLLCTKDNTRAELLAQNLSITNRERQLILEETTIHAKSLSSEFLGKKLIFLSHESYNQGVIGLVAGKLVDEFYLPAIVISKGEKYSKASARSIAGFNIVEAIREFSDLLVDVGGHPMAAGFTVETNNLLFLKKKLTELAERELSAEILQRMLKIDCEIDLENINFKFFQEIQKLAPFGIGNPIPTFVSRNIKVVKIGLIGKDKKHIKLTLQPDPKYNHYVGAIGFGMGQLYGRINFENFIDIAYTIDENDWNNKRSLQLKLKDVKFSS